jgi:hypothetical protein
MIRDELVFARAENNEIFYPCFILKGAIMKRYFLTVFLYFLYEIVINGIIPIFNQIFTWDNAESDANMNALPGLRQHIFDFIIVSAILVNFRPRQWPPLFNI